MPIVEEIAVTVVAHFIADRPRKMDVVSLDEQLPLIRRRTN